MLQVLLYALENPSSGILQSTQPPPVTAKVVDQPASSGIMSASSATPVPSWLKPLVDAIQNAPGVASVAKALQHSVDNAQKFENQITGGLSGSTLLFYALFAAILLIGLLGLVLESPEVQQSAEIAAKGVS